MDGWVHCNYQYRINVFFAINNSLTAQYTKLKLVFVLALAVFETAGVLSEAWDSIFLVGMIKTSSHFPLLTRKKALALTIIVDAASVYMNYTRSAVGWVTEQHCMRAPDTSLLVSHQGTTDIGAINVILGHFS